DFTIAGDSREHEDYVSSLIAKCIGIGNIKLDVRFLSDKDIDDLIEDAHILCLPYNIASSQNSGVAIYAFSKGINVVIPEIETIQDLRNKDAVYSYRYDDVMEHLERLEGAIIEAKKDYFDNYMQFVDKADRLHEEIVVEYSLDEIADEFNKVLTNI
ncbi:MAG: hypothetical protein K2L07_13225, partial [Lachnospiraceae bacterium]|nr:hypothetical protein [Lachnospiraceae bacterium]